MANVVEIVIRGVDKLRAPFTKSIKTMDDFRQSVRGLSTLAAGAAVTAGGALITLAVRASNAAEEAKELSEIVGFDSVEAFSKLQFAAELTNVSISDLRTGLNQFNRNLVKAAGDGTDKVARSLAAMGVQLTDSNGNLRANEDILLDVSEAFAGYADSAEKSALAVQLFGESGARMLPLLNQGKDGIKALGDETVGFTDEMADQAAEFNKRMKILRRQVFDIGVVIAVQLLPFLTEFSQWLVKIAKDSNAASTVASTFVEVVKALAIGLAAMATAASTAAKGIENLFYVIGTAVFEALKVVDNAWDEIKENMKGFAKVLQGLVSRDFKRVTEGLIEFQSSTQALVPQVEEAWENIKNAMVTNSVEAFKEIQAEWEAFNELMMKLSAPDGGAGFTETPLGGAGGAGGVAGKPPTEAETEILIENLKLKEASLELVAQEQELLLEMELMREEQHAAAIGRLAELAEFNATTAEMIKISHQGWLTFISRTGKTVFRQLSSAITGIIMGTKSAKEAFKQLGQAMVQMVINFIAQKLIAFALERVMQAVGLALAKSTAATTATIAATLAVAWAPAATAALVATYGAAASAGSALLPLMAANAAAAGSIAVAGGVLGGAAGGGLDFVPADKTFLLHRGERVLQPEANRDLTDFLANGQDAGVGGQVAVVVNLDGDVLARAVGEMTRDGRIEIDARSVV